MSTYTWQSGSGHICVTFANLDQCRLCADPSPRDLDVADLSTNPAIAAQLATIDDQMLARELDEYGTWSYAELGDHDQNLQRLLWIAGADVWKSPNSYMDAPEVSA